MKLSSLIEVFAHMCNQFVCISYTFGPSILHGIALLGQILIADLIAFKVMDFPTSPVMFELINKRYTVPSVLIWIALALAVMTHVSGLVVTATTSFGGPTLWHYLHIGLSFDVAIFAFILGLFWPFLLVTFGGVATCWAMWDKDV